MAKRVEPVVAYLRTSSATNVGADKDSVKRQRAAIEAFAKSAGFAIVGEYYDKAVSGADRIDQRPGFTEMLQRLATDGAKTILVESPDRFARDWPCSSPAMTCSRLSASRSFLLRLPTSSSNAYGRPGSPGARCHRSIREGQHRCEIGSGSQAQA